MKVCITGGCGFVGSKLAERLLDSSIWKDVCSVVLIDIVPPQSSEESKCASSAKKNARLEFVRVDLSDTEVAEATLKTVFVGAEVVFHIASYGMSGSAQLDKKRIRNINVEGTRALLRAAKVCGVRRIVYTSTYNVVFGGQSISAGTEKLPYFPIDSHADEYSRSKAQAEMEVLASNGATILSSNSDMNYTLRTCSIRPAAIWGPGETRHQPRVVKYAQKGILAFVFGRSDAKVDFVHVDNLVQAQILAAKCLDPSGDTTASGQVYFISDGEEQAINNFEFFGKILEGLGYTMPSLRIPLGIVYSLAYVSEKLCLGMALLGAHFEPLLTRAETLKAGVNHWFDISKARNELGYVPVKKSHQEVIDWFRDRGFSNPNKTPPKGQRMLLFSFVLLLVLVIWIGLFSGSNSLATG